MKKLMKCFTILFTMLLFALSTFAQSTATANVTATILQPITISKTIDMNFGNASVGATLHVAGNQAVGVYAQTVPFSVTVNYN